MAALSKTLSLILFFQTHLANSFQLIPTGFHEIIAAPDHHSFLMRDISKHIPKTHFMTGKALRHLFRRYLVHLMYLYIVDKPEIFLWQDCGRKTEKVV